MQSKQRAPTALAQEALRHLDSLHHFARYLTGRLDRERRVSFDNGALLYYYTAAQILVGLVLVHGFPRMVD